MDSSSIVSADSKLGRVLQRIPPNARCVVEGGHLTARVEHVHDRRLRNRKDGCYLVVATDHPAPLSGEILRGAYKKEDDRIQWVVIRPELDQVIDLPDRSTGVGDVYTVTYEPSETQQRSLRLALDLARQLSARVNRIRVAILIGDLDIPPSLRPSLEWLIPESYKAMLDETGLRSSVHLYSEAACRNQGKRRLLDPRKERFEHRETAEQIYKEHGYTLFRDFGYGALYLSSDYALQRLLEFPYLVAVTKDAKTATCGLILAGKLLSISKDGFTHFLSVYDEDDDARIRRKNIDGFLIFAHMIPEHQLNVVLCTFNTVGGLEQQPKIDEISSDEIKRPGRLKGGLDELLEITRKKNRVPGLNFIDVMSPGAYCSPDGNRC
jgi:hypothetical protein